MRAREAVGGWRNSNASWLSQEFSEIMEAVMPGEGQETRQHTTRSYKTNHAPTSTARGRSARREFSFNAQKVLLGGSRRCDGSTLLATIPRKKKEAIDKNKKKNSLLERERSATTTEISGLFPTGTRQQQRQ